jgi:imidazolonepropionase-like amidohydrolase
VGPRVIAGCRYLSPYGNYPSWIPNLPTENLIVVSDEAGIRKAVYSQFLDRVDIVKILGSGEGSTSHIPTFLERDIRLITDLAHLQGKRVFMHARAGAAAVYGARAGVDVVLHGDYMTDQQIDEFAKSQSAMSPVLCMAANSAAYGSLVGISEQAADFFRGRVKASAEVSRKLYDRGVALVAGSESGFGITPHGEWHFREVELLVEEVGLSPLEAIKAGTANAAAAVGLGQTTGVVAENKSADLLVVAGDLEQDIKSYGDPERRVLTYAGGRPVRAVEVEERRILSFERVRRMTTGVLTRRLAATGTIGSEDAGSDGLQSSGAASGASGRSDLWR